MTQREFIKQQRETHHKALEKLTGRPGEGLKIWRRLRRLEARAHRITTALCNGEVTQDDVETALDAVKAEVSEITGPDFLYLNRDPRGYALKLRQDAPDYGLHRDWGGYQILAPEIG